jgi:hypothetical protein
MNSVKDESLEIKYSILNIIDLSLLQDLSPDNFRKLKRKDYLDYLALNWSLEELLLILCHSSFYT